MGLVSTAMSHLGARKARKSAKKEVARAERLEQEELAMQRERMEKWESVFGPLQQNIADTVGAYTPDRIASTELSAFDKEVANATTKFREVLAQRGISPDSGVALSMERDLALESATGRATIRAEAPLKSIREQERFLQIGMGLNPAGDLGATLSGRSGRANERMLLAAQAAGQAQQAFTSQIAQQETEANEMGMEFMKMYTGGGMGFGG